MQISPFKKGFDRAAFGCGVDELDAYLKRQLSQEVKKNTAAAFILHEAGSSQILGYYTLSAFSIELKAVPDDLSSKLPRYPQVPATMLGRLAVDQSAQGQGLGELLLMDGLRRSWENRAIIGSWALVVDALGENAERFYKHFGFRQIEGQNGRLFLTMKEIGKLFVQD